jgi:hypothetical protein
MSAGGLHEKLELLLAHGGMPAGSLRDGGAGAAAQICNRRTAASRQQLICGKMFEQQNTKWAAGAAAQLLVELQPAEEQHSSNGGGWLAVMLYCLPQGMKASCGSYTGQFVPLNPKPLLLVLPCLWLHVLPKYGSVYRLDANVSQASTACTVALLDHKGCLYCLHMPCCTAQASPACTAASGMASCWCIAPTS